MLVALSLELTTCVLEHVRPIDIVSVRQTCRTLFNVTKLRLTWVNALRSVMKQHAIPDAMLNFDDMPLRMLEHVALSPHRLLCILQRSDGSSIRPMTIRVLSPRLTHEEKGRYGITDNNDLYDSYVEASGRYLASLSAYESFTLITVWDLGLCGSDAIKPLARYLQPTQSKLYLDGLWPGPQGSNTFYVVATQESSLLTPLFVFVHKVSILDPPEITFLAKLEIPVPGLAIFARISHSPDTGRLVIHYEDDEDRKQVWVWDFLRDTVAVLVATDYEYAGREMLLHYDDCIMMGHGGCIKVYNLPPLLPRNSGGSPTECEATIIIAAPSKSPSSFFIGHDMTQTIPSYFSEVTSSRLTFFEVTDSNQCYDWKLPNKLPLVAASVEVGDQAFWSRNQRFNALNRCEDHILLPSFSNVAQESGDLVIFSVNIGKPFRGNYRARLNKTILSSSLGRHEITRRQFCTMLGRLCIHTKHRSPDSPSVRCIYVLDYLAAPE